MLQRKPVFPHVIEMNYQAGRALGCNVYLSIDGAEWLLIDIGFDDTVDEIVELIRQLDFQLSHCKMLIATHADADHIQGLAKVKQLLKTQGRRPSAGRRAAGDGRRDHDLRRDRGPEHPSGDAAGQARRAARRGRQHRGRRAELEVWHTPGHTDSQLSFRLGNLLFSGDNIYRDGCVGAIDAHHGSDIPAFIKSLKRIRASDVECLLPSHGPIFRKDNALLEKAIARLEAICTWPTSAPAPSTGR